eukprot:475343-Alexandrium_andersonii.AAC.1
MLGHHGLHEASILWFCAWALAKIQNSRPCSQTHERDVKAQSSPRSRRVRLSARARQSICRSW